MKWNISWANTFWTVFKTKLTSTSCITIMTIQTYRELKEKCKKGHFIFKYKNPIISICFSVFTYMSISALIKLQAASKRKFNPGKKSSDHLSIEPQIFTSRQWQNRVFQRYNEWSLSTIQVFIRQWLYLIMIYTVSH